MTKILLADDSVTIQKVVELTFSDEESQVLAVGDGMSALEKVQMDRPDIILSDVIMPGLNGYELCQKIKADPNLKNIPFLFLKGTFESFDEEMAKQCGADGFIVKPFESQELINKVKELVATSAPASPSPPPAEQPMPQVAAVIPAAAAPPSPDETVFDLAFETSPQEAEAAIVNQPASPSAESKSEQEDDLWSEVSLRDSSSPLLEDKVLEEEALWGTPAEASSAPPVASEEPAGEVLLEEVEETEIFDLTEDTAAPSMTQPVEEVTEIFEPVAEETVSTAQPVAKKEPPPQEAIPHTAAPVTVPSAAEVTPGSGAVPTDELEKVVAARMEEALRTHLAAMVGDSARKILEEIAWEVIPDLAEAMIRSEIERIRRETG